MRFERSISRQLTALKVCNSLATVLSPRAGAARRDERSALLVCPFPLVSNASASSGVAHQASSTSRATVRSSGFGRPDAVFSFITRGYVLFARAGAGAAPAAEAASKPAVSRLPAEAPQYK
jgi:hypothetical protein